MSNSDASTRSFPLGRLAALITVVAMTALPFVSCGPMNFNGHEILRNKIPDFQERLDAPGSGGEVKSNVDADKSLFSGDDQWLHYLYVVAFALAVFALFPRRALLAAIGIAGLAAVVAFIVGFDSMLKREKSPTGISLEIGAILSLAGFAVVAFAGFRQGRGNPPRAAGTSPP